MLRFFIPVIGWLVATTLFASHTAQAETSPLLLRQLETEIGGTRSDPAPIAGGSVHSLTLENAESGLQSIQLATDALGTPTLVRVAQVINGGAAAKAFVSASVLSLELARTASLEAVTPQAEALATAITKFAQSPTAQTLSLPLPDGPALQLTLDAANRVALFDIPVTRPVPTPLDRDGITDLLSDATTVTRSGTRYHLPDGRLVERRSDGRIIFGAWRADETDGYCLERAPRGGFTCYSLYQDGRDRAVQLSRAVETAGAESVDVLFGNPEGLPSAQRGDAIAADVARRLISGKTGGRVASDGTRRDLFFRADGTFSGTEAGQPLTGAWSVLSDGRLCVVPQDATSFECTFLSETDGGTFRHFTEDQTLVGEAQYTEGNPNGY